MGQKFIKMLFTLQGMRRAIIFDWKGTLFNERTGQLYPLAKLIVRQAKTKYKLGLVSLGNFERIQNTLEQIGLLHYFTSIVIGQEKAMQQFAECIEEIAVMPQDVLVVGDSAGITASNALGCKTCLMVPDESVSSHSHDVAFEPTHTISKIGDLRRLL